jgi:hypothetical protein
MIVSLTNIKVPPLEGVVCWRGSAQDASQRPRYNDFDWELLFQIMSSKSYIGKVLRITLLAHIVEIIYTYLKSHDGLGWKKLWKQKIARNAKLEDACMMR